MTDGMLSLSWKNHSTTFCHTLAALRSKERYTDATVACNGKFYSVHKLVLSSCSEYFEEIFDHTPCKHPVIVLRDVQVDELEAILNYMYAGEVSVAQCDLTRLIKVAELLKIKGLAVSDEPTHPRTEDSRNSSSEAPNHSRLSSPKRQKTLELTSESPAFGYRDEEQQQNATTRDLPDLHQADLNQEISSIHYQGQKQDINIKEEIVEITTDASENDMVLNFGILQEDRQLEGTLRGCPSDTNLMIKCQNLEPLGNQLAYSSGLTSTMSGPSEMQDWFPEPETATTLVEGENANRGNSCLQVRMEANDNMLPGRTVSPSLRFLHPLGGSHHSEEQNSYTPLQSSTDKNTKMYRSNVEKPYACPYCNFRSALKCNLKIHIRTHTGEKPYSCHLCPQRFSVRCNLKTHLRTHTGEKPFCCPHCSYRCAHKSDMNKHVMTHSL